MKIAFDTASQNTFRRPCFKGVLSARWRGSHGCRPLIVARLVPILLNFFFHKTYIGSTTKKASPNYIGRTRRLAKHLYFILQSRRKIFNCACRARFSGLCTVQILLRIIIPMKFSNIVAHRASYIVRLCGSHTVRQVARGGICLFLHYSVVHMPAKAPFPVAN